MNEKKNCLRIKKNFSFTIKKKKIKKKKPPFYLKIHFKCT
jgi:hypothetical protein